ncbi:PIN-like domain-containing protein [Paenibacillus sp. FSL E2-8871]|uniref:PIN-like domain-containing protein n=1 Tax=Paenibacillus sp. FSL E2-8871 TaxID=2975326 RepID=UPI0030FBB74F
MGSWKKAIFQPKSLEELINSACVVIDTNVLLAAYQWKEVTVNEVLDALNQLAEAGRLLIPNQVVTEFAKNRPGRIIEMVRYLQQISQSLQPQKKLDQTIPALYVTENYDEILQLEKDYIEALNKYKAGLKSLKMNLIGLYQQDPILEKLEGILSKSYYEPTEILSNADLEKAAQERFKNKIPPGYKDSNKEENNSGDYIIWANILTIKADVIFITADKKPDWTIKDPDDNVICARRELIEEFYESSNGHSFVLVSPKDFFSKFKPNVSEIIQDDLSNSHTIVAMPVEQVKTVSNTIERIKSMIEKGYFNSETAKKAEYLLSNLEIYNDDIDVKLDTILTLLENDVKDRNKQNILLEQF